MQPGPRKVHHHPLHLRRLKLHICLFAKFSAVRQHTNTRFSAFSKGTEEESCFPGRLCRVNALRHHISKPAVCRHLRQPARRGNIARGRRARRFAAFGNIIHKVIHMQRVTAHKNARHQRHIALVTQRPFCSCIQRHAKCLGQLIFRDQPHG